MSATRVRKTRQKTPPDPPVAGPSHDAKGNTSHRARRLDFAAKKPLAGKKFYLELTGPRRKVQYGKLKAEIEELGGVVEPFLSKDLACVISDRAEARDGERSKGMPSGTSPAVSTPSPFHQTKDSTPNAADSPSHVTQDTRVVTRGQAIVQKATKSQMYGTTNVLINAKNFNIPIKHLDVLLKYLSREREKLKLSAKDKKKGGKEVQSAKGKERQLTKPYLKAEDVSRRFRPIHKEFKTWPRILLDTRRGSCPYDPTTRNESNPQGAERTQDRPDASQKTPDVSSRSESQRSPSSYPYPSWSSSEDTLKDYALTFEYLAGGRTQELEIAGSRSESQRSPSSSSSEDTLQDCALTLEYVAGRRTQELQIAGYRSESQGSLSLFRRTSSSRLEETRKRHALEECNLQLQYMEKEHALKMEILDLKKQVQARKLELLNKQLHL